MAMCICHGKDTTGKYQLSTAALWEGLEGSVLLPKVPISADFHPKDDNAPHGAMWQICALLLVLCWCVCSASLFHGRLPVEVKHQRPPHTRTLHVFIVTCSQCHTRGNKPLHLSWLPWFHVENVWAKKPSNPLNRYQGVPGNSNNLQVLVSKACPWD